MPEAPKQKGWKPAKPNKPRKTIGVGRTDNKYSEGWERVYGKKEKWWKRILFMRIW